MLLRFLSSVLIASTAVGWQIPSVPDGLDLSGIRAIPLQQDGRWPPLDTVARDMVKSVTGEEFYGGHDPVAVLLAWTFDAATWRQAPLIEIDNAELRGELDLPAAQTVYSFAELTSQKKLHALVDDLKTIPKGKKQNPLQKKVGEIHEKLLELHSIFTGKAIRMIPDASDPLGAWQPASAGGLSGDAQAEALPELWSAVGGAFLAQDAPAFARATERLAAQLARLAPEYRPKASLIRTELRYNRLRPFRLAWIVMVIATVLSLAAVIVRRRWFDVLAILGLIAGFGTVSYGLSMRWQIAGRIPASNMFESLLFLGWGMGAFAIVAMIVVRHRIVPLTASFMGAVALMLADLLPMNQFVRPISPVLLDTIWMSIHVPIIMVSYSVLTLGVLIAHIQLVSMAAFPSRRELSTTLDAWHYWYINVGSFLLTIGIVTGSMWAASSWGRYWGWDPKEVWSLVALLGYLAILHLRIDQERTPTWVFGFGIVVALVVMVLVVSNFTPLTAGRAAAFGGVVAAVVLFIFAKGMFATALKSVLAFWLIIMTYVGVNFVLGIGLHSYGFGTGAVVHYMYRIGGIDLGLALLCTLVYLWRRRGSSIAVAG